MESGVYARTCRQIQGYSAKLDKSFQENPLGHIIYQGFSM
jgi:hypothetical protein